MVAEAGQFLNGYPFPLTVLYFVPSSGAFVKEKNGTGLCWQSDEREDPDQTKALKSLTVTPGLGKKPATMLLSLSAGGARHASRSLMPHAFSAPDAATVAR